MTGTLNLRDQALSYHQRLPARLWKYLNERGIPDVLVHQHLLGWDGRRITIPITNRDGKIAFFKLAKDPEEQTNSPKMLATPGASTELYGWQRVLARPSEIVICEGEFDRLVLEANGFPAVTSTGGAGVSRPEWAEEFKPIAEVYICFDRDEAGQEGAKRVAQLISHGKIVELPHEVGEGGDVTDFFVRLGRTREDFIHLLEGAQLLPAEERLQARPSVRSQAPANGETDALKSGIAIEEILSRYIPLRRSGQNYIGRCSFHEDRNPSLVVYPATQTFHCYGCQAHGDVFSFLMRAEGLTFPEALKVLHRLTR